jgi:type I restriction enzyme R subunit
MPDFFNPYEEIDTTAHKLPHWQQGEAWIFVTWRQADSIPTAKLHEWQEERDGWLKHHPKPWDAKTEKDYKTRFLAPFEKWLDAGYGSCALQDPANRQILTDALHHFEGDRYHLGDYVIMPNHVHLLFSPIAPQTLPKIVQSWKRHSARLINERTKRTGETLWQPDYFDRIIRSEEHLSRVKNYIARNPENLPNEHYTLRSADL